MLFNSFEFVLFLPIVFLLYWFVFRSRRIQNLFVVFASYLFYGWWDWRFLILIAITTLSAYGAGLLIARYEGRRLLQRWISAANIVLNLLILGVFKYYNFFAENMSVLLHEVGWEVDWVTLDILLPVGISFYTFQALSYSIDVYGKRLEACKDVVAFFAYISFFPQLVAGPIERATSLLPQFYRSRRFDYAQAVDGCRQVLWGFFKKMVIADNCAEAVSDIWVSYPLENAFALWMGGVLFSFQIYGDFSGYSDIAIGTARLFGVNLNRNFNFPYFSRDIAEFWRRWHISLTTWFRDYIYIPLGGSRCVRWKVMRNTMIIFLVSGLWHGANWTFVCWGAYHALLFFPLMWLGRNRKYTEGVAAGRWYPSLKEAGQMFLTFQLVVIGWIIFRSDSISQAWDYLSRMCSLSFFEFSLSCGWKTVPFILGMLLVEWLQRDKQHALQLPHAGVLRYRAVRVVLYYALILTIFLQAGSPETFVYFQF